MRPITEDRYLVLGGYDGRKEVYFVARRGDEWVVLGTDTLYVV
jgi:hypothetical protein